MDERERKKRKMLREQHARKKKTKKRLEASSDRSDRQVANLSE